jgi:hypothetical protein
MIRADELQVKPKIYRYNFSDEFAQELYEFSKTHQYDDRESFKEAWDNWTEENEELIEEETVRLYDLNYTGDVMNKMFKSARYYFRKKGTEKKAPAKHGSHTYLKKSLLEEMDRHISENLDKKPSESYAEFVKLCESGETREKYDDISSFEDKMKKAYKNRYFIIASKTGV